MTVYFIRTASGPIKIGYTAGHPDKRLRTLQTGHVEQLTLIAFMDGGVDVERELHKRFAEHRQRGEWFRDSPEIMAFLEPHRVSEPVKRNIPVKTKSGKGTWRIRLEIPTPYDPEAGDVPWSELTGKLLPYRPARAEQA